MLDEEFKKATLDEFQKIDKRFDVVESDISELKSDVAVLKSDVSELKSDVAELKTDVKELKVEFIDMKSILLTINNALISLEHSTSNQYAALFDANVTNLQKHKIMEDDIEALKKDTERIKAENEIKYAILKKQLEDSKNKRPNKTTSTELKII